MVGLDARSPVLLPVLRNVVVGSFCLCLRPAESLELEALGTDTFLAFQRDTGVLCDNKRRLGRWRSWHPDVVDDPEPFLAGAGVHLVPWNESAEEFHHVPCVNDQESYLASKVWVTNRCDPLAFEARGQEAVDAVSRCVSRCGFGVFDNVLPETELAMALTLVRDKLYEDGVHEHVAALLAPSLLRTISRHLEVPETSLHLRHKRLDPGVRNFMDCEMHADFHSERGYVFTAIVYLSDSGVDFQGGETVLVHDVAGPLAANVPLYAGAAGPTMRKELWPMSSGLVVQPKTGRVLLFSSGNENLHCKMRSSTGTQQTGRLVIQLWFACCEDCTLQRDRQFEARKAADTFYNTEL